MILAEEEGRTSARFFASRKSLILLSLLAIFLAALVLGWSVRKPIARDFVDKALRQRGVSAQYEITHFGFRRQRMEHVVIGDPRHPDLTAEWAEVQFGLSGLSPSLRKIRASGVRLKGKLIDGRLSLGAIDKLLPPVSGKPFSLPDIDVEVTDARMRLDTSGGAIGLALDGGGNLSDGFSGQLAAIARNVDQGGCRIERPAAVVHIAISGGRPAIDGPARAARIDCGALAVQAPQAALDIAFGDALDSWNGGAMFAIVAVSSGNYGASALRGRLGFQGTARNTDAKLRLSAKQLRADGLVDRISGMNGTPVGPLVVALHDAAARALESVDVEGSFNLDSANGVHTLRAAPLAIRTGSGARMDLSASGNGGVGWRSSDGQWLLDGGFTLSGGGFPDAFAQLKRTGAGITGSLHVEPFTAGTARLAVEPVRFGNGRFSTRLVMTGPLADGHVDELALAIDGRTGRNGSFLINSRCTPLSFQRIEIAGTQIAAARLPLCPVGPALFVRDVAGRIGGGAAIAGPRLQGRVGGSPLTMAAARLSASIARPGFAMDRLVIRLGTGQDPTRLDVARLQGRTDATGFSGDLAGAAGKIGNVPLLVSAGAGKWTLRSSVLDLHGHMALDDAADDPRFHQLVSDDVALMLKNGVISGTATLKHPRTNARITHIALRHDLGKGAGQADLDVPGLEFSAALQPEMLTRLTLGVIANARGKVAGQGHIAWNRAGVHSTGDFATDRLDFAAAFGPVERLAGKIHFSDLLAMATPPGQSVTIGAINTGVAVNDGIVRYQLLPNQIIQVESGRWPFSGGQLALLPTRLDFGQPSDRHLTFRIEGMDAALFVEQFGFKNIAVTGTFDGVLPMIFDLKGGRIEGGKLVVRQAGGKLSYVGEISNEKLGRFGNMAFDALKSIRYTNLAILLDGSLDGEIISKVVFTGTNEAPVATKKGLLRGLVGLPFKFNITIKAPFRSLVNSAQSINDPRGLVSGSLKQLRDQQQTPAVQPQESGKVP